MGIQEKKHEAKTPHWDAWKERAQANNVARHLALYLKRKDETKGLFLPLVKPFFCAACGGAQRLFFDLVRRLFSESQNLALSDPVRLISI